jgi:hypothetical protein
VKGTASGGGGTFIRGGADTKGASGGGRGGAP